MEPPVSKGRYSLIPCSARRGVADLHLTERNSRMRTAMKHVLALWIVVLSMPALRARAGDLIPVPMRVFDVEYAVPADAHPLSSVQLWYTTDSGETWHQYGYDEDRQSPITFHAPTEGAFGFFFVVANASGTSAQPPGRGTAPQLQVFVDYTLPVVQLHDLRQTSSLGRRVVQVRWTAIDAQLPPRPVELVYRRPPSESWEPVVAEPLANTGRFDWRVPEELSGSVAVRVVVRDRGGNQAESAEMSLELLPFPTAADAVVSTSTLEADGATKAVPIEEAVRLRVERLLVEGRALRERGDHRRAISRLREAVALDPQCKQAFDELGALLYRIGDLERAQSAYDIALRLDPNLRSALVGSADVLREQRSYGAAAERLRAVLRAHPQDADAWIRLGDLGIFQGDELLARECYLRAAKIDPQSTALVEEAQRRLLLMAEANRNPD